MNPRPITLIILLLFLYCSAAKYSQSNGATTRSPYLNQFPSVDKVLNAMKTSDPRETAIRQLGAFYQLVEIIKTLSGCREFRGFTPDEQRVIGMYQTASYNLGETASKSFPGVPKHGEATDLTSHGRGGVKRWLLGSVAEKLIRRVRFRLSSFPRAIETTRCLLLAKRQVWLRSFWRRFERGDQDVTRRFFMFDLILIPLDGSEAAEAALAVSELIPSRRVRLLTVESDLSDLTAICATEPDCQAYLERVA